MTLAVADRGTGQRRLAEVRAAQIHAAPWPYAQLDVAARRSAGWRPTPITELVLKVHQRCNLACDYCYVYSGPDQSWRDRPAAMSDHTRRAALDRLARHAARHGLTSVRVILHGGEPLLYGAARLGELAGEIRAAVPSAVIGIQTNGVLLTEPTMAVLRRHGIRVGVSVDGTREDHDRHRLTRGGRPTFAAVSRALALLNRPENRDCYAGLLCTVAPETDPVATFDQLCAFEPPVIDLLLPHANWLHRPAGDGYGAWLIAVFDRWYAAVNPPRVRLFEDIIRLMLGAGSRSEQVGLSPCGVVVVESDGAIEQVDALKSAYPGACATGLDVHHDDLDDALADPGIVARQIGLDALSPRCLDCPVSRVCGGGHYAHRYDRDGFRNPTVYCADMRALIGHVWARIAHDAKN